MLEQYGGIIALVAFAVVALLLLLLRASSKREIADEGADEEVTQEMIDAGVEAMRDPFTMDRSDMLVMNIYTEMRKVARRNEP